MPPRGAALLLLVVCVQLGISSSTSIAAYLFGFWSRTHQHRFSALAPAPSPQPQRPIISHPVHRHHRKRPHSYPPPSSSERQDCSGTACSAPLTSTPIGSPCGCVYAMQIQLNLGVAPYQLFPRIDELEIEIAAGTFLKQSQVRIMGAGSSLQDPEKTTVTIDLVPLGQKFDRTSALLISNRFLQKKVPINSSIFGDYDVTYVHYPGLPSLVPIPGSLGPVSGNEHPFGANIHNRSHHKINSKMVAIIALSAVVLVLMCFAIGIVWRYKGFENSHATGRISNSSITRKGGLRSSCSNTSSSAASFASTIGTYPSTVKTFTISELEKATGNFSFSKIIGEGGYGRVYRGIIEDGIDVAVKLLTRKHQNRDREFIAEVEMLSRLHHRNLVKLIGICIERSTRCLVFELVPNGSVESHLHGSDKIYGPLDFDTRMKIALGAARGLAYLHEDANPHVIHRDFKASNVLMENDFTPKVADFGLAKEASDGIEHISTQVMGTFGYVAPEYAMTGHLLVKSDVYSYGVVLLELLSGRKPVDMTQPPGSENLVTWARPLLTSREGLQRLVDPSMPAGYNFEKLAKAAAIASMCVNVEASHRPFMGEVVQALKLIHSCCGGDETRSGSFGGGATGQEEGESPWDDGSRSTWNDAAVATPPRLAYGSDPIGADERRPRSASSAVLDKIESLAMHDWSGPLRAKGGHSFYRLRGSMSEHGRPSDDGSVEGYWM
ncbi:receptor-like serine/threonine-protein kinase ALE2 [Phragmites australis]|uniref:receptor-like serine/threonine-protein kinase ALE2 n=1 Tax=Phragmites australis TaxID=29695 RepID=UPI002D7A1A89|nr:receptor-like serine/threonine-protein kinase ALE2 [Phragmites australis]